MADVDGGVGVADEVDFGEGQALGGTTADFDLVRDGLKGFEARRSGGGGLVLRYAELAGVGVFELYFEGTDGLCSRWLAGYHALTRMLWASV